MSRSDEFRRWVEQMKLSPAQKTVALNYIDAVETVDLLARDMEEQAKVDPDRRYSSTMIAALARLNAANAPLQLEIYGRPEPMGRAGVEKLLAHAIANHLGECVRLKQPKQWKTWLQENAVKLAWPVVIFGSVLAVTRPEILTMIITKVAP